MNPSSSSSSPADNRNRFNTNGGIMNALPNNDNDGSDDSNESLGLLDEEHQNGCVDSGWQKNSSSSSPPRIVVSENAEKICIVGGGVAGIAACRVLASRGFDDITLLEESESFSGVWAAGYPGFAIQTPGKFYEFPDKELPEPKDFKDGESIRKYCEEYLEEHDLLRFARLNTRVTSIVAVAEEAENNNNNSNKWKVTSRCGANTTSEVYDFVVLATGLYSPKIKFLPKIEGMEEYFEGNVYHSVETAGIPNRGGKRVVVVGYGKSAHDCAMNAFRETGVPPTLLFRSAHWCVPRKILGLFSFENGLYSRFGQGIMPGWKDYGPVESFVHTFLWPLVWLLWRMGEMAMTVQLGLYGSSAHLRPAMPMEKDLYLGHGIVCHPDMFPMMHRRDIVPIKGSIEKILPSGKLRLDNGSVLEADEIVFATGYKREFGFLPRELLAKKEDDGFYAYRHMLVPGVPNICFLNSNAITFSNIATPAIQAAWLAEALRGNIRFPDNAAEIVEKDMEWRREHLSFCGEARSYFIQVHTIRYWDSLLRDMGAATKRKSGGGSFLVAMFRNFFFPLYPSDYRSIVTGEWKQDPRQVARAHHHGSGQHNNNNRSSFFWEWCLLGSLLIALAMVRSVSGMCIFVACCLLVHATGLWFERVVNKNNYNNNYQRGSFIELPVIPQEEEEFDNHNHLGEEEPSRSMV